MKIGIAAIFKNEFDYILEWLAYHQLIGVDNFYIADNVSDDGTSQLLEALDYLGVIRRMHFPRIGEEPPQVGAYNRILGDFGGEVDLMAFIDADEFLAPTGPETLKEYLQPFQENEDVGALALNWCNFGSSGQYFTGVEPVIGRFTRCSHREYPVNRHIKTILKPSMAQKMLIHHCALKAGRYYDAKGKPAVFEKGTVCEPRTAEVEYGGLRVNHYVVKSREEHIRKKLKKGSCAGSASRRKGEDYFHLHDRNECEDLSLQPLVSDVRSRKADLRSSLEQASPYLAFGRVHGVVRGRVVQGWVRTDFDGPLKVRVLINNEERLVDVDQERPDVMKNSASNKLVCGFRYRHSRDLTSEDAVIVSLYGCLAEAEVQLDI